MILSEMGKTGADDQLSVLVLRPGASASRRSCHQGADRRAACLMAERSISRCHEQHHQGVALCCFENGLIVWFLLVHDGVFAAGGDVMSGMISIAASIPASTGGALGAATTALPDR